MDIGGKIVSTGATFGTSNVRGARAAAGGRYAAG